MKILADENIARDVVSWMRAEGHDVVFASEAMPGTPDVGWANHSIQDQRLILTFDKDFGDLVFRDGLHVHGLVLFRLDDLTVAQILARVQSAWSVIEANPSDRFIVVTERKIRVRPLPTP